MYHIFFIHSSVDGHFCECGAPEGSDSIWLHLIPSPNHLLLRTRGVPLAKTFCQPSFVAGFYKSMGRTDNPFPYTAAPEAWNGPRAWET